MLVVALQSSPPSSWHPPSAARSRPRPAHRAFPGALTWAPPHGRAAQAAARSTARRLRIDHDIDSIGQTDVDSGNAGWIPIPVLQPDVLPCGELRIVARRD